jgi:hypothetical protein
MLEIAPRLTVFDAPAARATVSDHSSPLAAILSRSTVS